MKAADRIWQMKAAVIWRLNALEVIPDLLTIQQEGNALELMVISVR